MTPRIFYQDEQTTLWLGDCREVLPRLGPVDAVITDPPYGVGMKAFADDFSVAAEALRLCSGNLAVVFMSPRRIVEFANLLEPHWQFERCLWMHKRADIAFPWHGWHLNSEAILLFSRAGTLWPVPQSYRTDVYEVGPWGKNGHPSAKPEWVVRDLIEKTSTGVIFDPFAGSGTTLVAAKRLGHKSIGVEIDETFCRLTVERLQQEVLPFPVKAAPVQEQGALFAAPGNGGPK